MSALLSAAKSEPDRDCPLCPRLVAFRQEWRAKEPGWFNAPVHSFGPIDARLLIVGLAPGVRGANRTGRPFTGDYAGDLLYATLAAYGFSRFAFERAGRWARGRRFFFCFGWDWGCGARASTRAASRRPRAGRTRAVDRR